ncbi:hypothetical protein HPB49_018628 [Dermacentor silvarum]|uniref:Uncharacterized protein n=1 Tax=Dermacentor silvarum TaxID=543639 RepID=A0ACB8C501_DERSI|nr:hypothetical protein HPB49_018628 [Dermacentor silvarum]
MAGNPNANDACLPATGPVELVPTQRGGFKAEYLGRTFTMESRKRSRYYWRCDIRCCKARLSTDVYGSDHMVYTFKAHNERLHQRATCETKRKRCSATNMKKPIVPIGNFNYVLEKANGGLKFWRCKYSTCPGRCRPLDGHLVVGPSEHQCPDKQQPEMMQDSDGAEVDQPHNDGVEPQVLSQGCSHQQQEEKQEEPKEKKRTVQEQAELEEDGDQKTRPILSGIARVAGEQAVERCAPLCTEEAAEPRQLRETADDFQDAHCVYDSEPDDANQDGRSTVSAGSTNKNIDDDVKSYLSVGDDCKDDADQTLCNVSAKVKDEAAWINVVVSTDDEDSDGEDEAYEEHAILDHSVSGGANLKRNRPHAISGQVLEMTYEAYDKGKREIAVFRASTDESAAGGRD